MNGDIRILFLEDDTNDAMLVRSELERAGLRFTINRVETEESFLAALRGRNLDLILADYRLPHYDGLEALKLAHEAAPDVPFIFVTGTLGEERAIECLHNGATDYVLKDRLARLVPAVRRALREVTDRQARRKAEEQFIQAQKMEVVGQLAGSVAHDFNNILSVILGYHEVVMRQLEESHPARQDVEEIKHAAERAVGLTRQLLSFSRKQVFQPMTLDLNGVVAGLDNILKRLLDEHVELTIQLSPDLWPVEADSGYVGQVLMNMVVNARDAMPQGGKLTVSTRNTRLETTVASSEPRGDFVVLSVVDTGVGMSETVKLRLFEPFFTTKPTTKGTGLGLATCLTIVKQCGGHIEVLSEAGHGATFNIFFPRSHQKPATAKAPPDPTQLPRGAETLLLVEDEPAVRNLAMGILKNLGYEVLSASNGQDGLNMARSHKGNPISLVVTDVVMPRMGGKVMAEWLKSANPSLKILFTSGYSEEAISRQGALETGVAFLPKPYTPSSLSRTVRNILDAK